MSLDLGGPATGISPRAMGAHAAVRVEAPARLHLGFVDPSGSLGRRYGSFGVAIDRLATQVLVAFDEEDAFVIEPSHALPQLSRLRQHVDGLRRATGRRAPMRVVLERAPPLHAGFGSGTQLALALGRAFGELHRLELSTATAAELLARGARSGIGIATFDTGGLILDGGPRSGADVAPVLSRFDFPEDWRIVLALDDRQSGLHGTAETAAIADLPPFPQAFAADIAHELVMRLLPAVAERDFAPFARSLTHIQQRLGDYFAPAQHDRMFTSEDVARFFDWLHGRFEAGVGQSSWGPTGFAFVPSQAVADCVIAEARAAQVVSEHVRLLVVRGCNRGATVTLASQSG